MALEVKADAGLTVVLKLFQGEFQIGADISATESNSNPGFYSAPYPAGLAAGEYRLEGIAGGDDIIPAPFSWSGSSEITQFSIFRAISNGTPGTPGQESSATSGLTTAQSELLNQIWEFSRIAKQGVVGQYVVNIFSNTGTVFEDDKTTPIQVFDLKDADGAPTSKDVYSRIPRT